MYVLVALKVVSSQQAVLELRHVEHDGDPFQVQLQSSATDDVSSWSASIQYDFLFHSCLYDDCSGRVECNFLNSTQFIYM